MPFSAVKSPIACQFLSDEEVGGNPGPFQPTRLERAKEREEEAGSVVEGKERADLIRRWVREAARRVKPRIFPVMAIHHQTIPPTVNFTRSADGCALNLSNQPRKQKLDYVLSGAFTTGGQSGACVLKRYEP